MKQVKQQRHFLNSLGKSHLFEGNHSERDKFPEADSKALGTRVVTHQGPLRDSQQRLLHNRSLPWTQEGWWTVLKGPWSPHSAQHGAWLTPPSVNICWLKSDKMETSTWHFQYWQPGLFVHSNEHSGSINEQTESIIIIISKGSVPLNSFPY